jgi:hypothetical protein
MTASRGIGKDECPPGCKSKGGFASLAMTVLAALGVIKIFEMTVQKGAR